MPLTVNWNGTPIAIPTTESYWSNKGGLFTPTKGKSTYFPLPLSYRSAIPVVGTFTIPAAYKNRADLIAHHLYQSEDYWWLVYWMNGIIDPFATLNPGDIILIANIQTITSLLA